MNKLPFTLDPGDSLNHWLILGTFENRKTFEASTMDGEVNAWLKTGAASHEFPGRSEFISSREPYRTIPEDIKAPDLQQKVRYQGQQKTWELHLPFEETAVETKGFWSEPAHIESWAYTEIESSENQWVTFSISVCGGMSLWVNEVLQHTMAPFTRNKAQTENLTIPLNKGNNSIYVYYDDLAERDTKFLFRMDYISGNTSLKGMLPIAGEDPVEIGRMKELLEKGCFSQDTYQNEKVIFHLGKKAEHPFRVTGVFKVERCNAQTLHRELKSEDNVITFGAAETFQMGYHAVTVILSNGNVHLRKNFGIQIYPEPFQHFHADTLNDRKKLLLDLVSVHGEPNVHRVLAMFKATTKSSADWEEILREDVSWVEDRLDCSDFSIVMYFRLLDMDDREHVLTPALRNRIEQAVIDYRYWMDEPGNDVMWFFSENHALIFHTSELLAGQRYPDTFFPNASMYGKEHYEKARQLLLSWFERFFKDGLAEWNSSPYIPINVIGLIQLYDFSTDHEISQRALKALDYIFYWLAANSYNGYLTCSQGRVYEKELKGHYNTQTTNLSWLAWGAANINYSSFASVALALSTYIPPFEYSHLLSASNNTFVYYHTQGLDGEVPLYTFKSRGYMLSSALCYRPFEKGYQEHVWQASFGPEENIWVNHPGEHAKKGDGRPGYWAGNGNLPLVQQHRGILLSYFKIEEHHEVDFTHAYVPLEVFDECVFDENWLFLRKNNSYTALFAQNGYTLTTEGMDQHREVVSPGRSNLWLIRMGEEKEFYDFQTFRERILSTKIDVVYAKEQVKHITVNDPGYGNIHLNETGELFVDGSKVNNQLPSIEGALYL